MSDKLQFATYGLLLAYLLRERGWQCEYCGAPGLVLDADHAIYPKAVYRQRIPELDQEIYNFIVLGRNCCHASKAQDTDSGHGSETALGTGVT